MEREIVETESAGASTYSSALEWCSSVTGLRKDVFSFGVSVFFCKAQCTATASHSAITLNIPNKRNRIFKMLLRFLFFRICRNKQAVDDFVVTWERGCSFGGLKERFLEVCRTSTFCSFANHKLFAADLLLVRDMAQEINDSVINFFLSLFNAAWNGTGLCAVSTQFYQSASSRNQEACIRQLRPYGPLHEYKAVFFVCCEEERHHWTLLVLRNSLNGHSFEYCDSLPKSVSKPPPLVHIPVALGLTAEKWQRVRLPTQRNSVDCGLFVIYFIKHLSVALLQESPLPKLPPMNGAAERLSVLRTVCSLVE